MKIEYDPSLYKEIANFSVNEIVEVTNRKGRKHTIHITNITKLTWQELQLLDSNGADRFSKIVFLYRTLLASEINGKKLSSQEVQEIDAYIKIYRDNNCTKHHEVNEIITQQDIWGDFTTIRSLNDHGEFTGLEGIQPDYFGIICSILKISGEGGSPLDGYTKY